jgi:hypothetical protein
MTDAMYWQRIVEEFCEFNAGADRTVMYNFAGWLAARRAGADLGALRDALAWALPYAEHAVLNAANVYPAAVEQLVQAKAALRA